MEWSVLFNDNELGAMLYGLRNRLIFVPRQVNRTIRNPDCLKNAVAQSIIILDDQNVGKGLGGSITTRHGTSLMHRLPCHENYTIPPL